MYATYHLSSAQELSADLIEAIKAAFKSSPITITIEQEMETTDYLMSSPANKAMLDKSLEQAHRGEFIVVTVNEEEKTVKKTAKTQLLKRFKEAVQEVNDIKAGRLKGIDAKALLDEL